MFFSDDPDLANARRRVDSIVPGQDIAAHAALKELAALIDKLGLLVDLQPRCEVEAGVEDEEG
ncbi:hypothetical protein P608_18565 [Comamonas thiooxydans]|uniref:Uncharacterized protein n=1 Tax=Comamonas thiooxydans TaxID=363952 RepID=A0A0E3BRI4_9BURK|nr:hypothetical protein P608_18565 [Comamonas thiooxydans]KGH14390.1 hypothetical protein P607_22995 [Comamonas thiooxydans]